jgi:hypothetical protein
MKAPFLLPVLSLIFAANVRADPVTVRHTEGLVHGFLVLRSMQGELLASGDMTQTASGMNVTNRLVLKFRDGSLHDETTVFSQQRVFRLLTYHLVQKGPAFKTPLDLSINGTTGKMTERYTDEHGKEKMLEENKPLPGDLANGLVSVLLNDIQPGSPITTVSMLATSPKPRMVKLAISADGEENFSVGGITRKATRFRIKIEIGGISGVVAPMVGKDPPDIYVWVDEESAPVFLKSEGPWYDGGPIWRLEQAVPVWPKSDGVSHR